MVPPWPPIREAPTAAMTPPDPTATPEPEVLLDVAGAVATVTLNRPHRRNAISWGLVTGLDDALGAIEDDPHVRVVVLVGAGGDFSVGADLARVGSDDRADQETRTLRGRSFDDDAERLTVASAAARRLVDLGRPTIAEVTGACAGAGLSLALAADIRVASTTAVFNTAFVAAGVAGDLGSAWLLTRATGPAAATALLLDPRKLSAAEALERGLVTEVVEDAHERVQQLAAKLAHQSPTAMALAKANLRDALDLDLRDYLRAEVPRMVESAHSEDARQAARDFLERRRARTS